jgi:hypothetical protein
MEILATDKFVNLTPKVQNIVELTNIGNLDLNRMASMATRVIFHPIKFQERYLQAYERK